MQAPTHELTLSVSLPSQDADPMTFAQALLAIGFDGPLGVGSVGRIAIPIAEPAATRPIAIDLAMTKIRQAIPGAQLLSAYD